MTEVQHKADPGVIARIRKLMALTVQRGASEAEAEIATGHVQRLLAEHNLSMAAVEASGGSSGEHGRRTKETFSRRQVYKWQRDLMTAVAELNFCVAFPRWESRTGGPDIFDGYDLIGRIDNVATCRLMFDYLLHSIERLAREYVNNDPTQFFTRTAHSFKEGCSTRLTERLFDKHREIVEEQERKAREEQAAARHPAAASSNLPAIILKDIVQSEKDLNEDLRRGLEPGTTARRRQEQEEKSERQRLERERRFNEALAMGHDQNIAYFYSHGWDIERAIELARVDDNNEPAKPETEAQRKRRIESEKRAGQRYEERQRRRKEREHRRLDRIAFCRGQEAGETVSLHRQVDGTKRNKLGKAS